MRAKSIKGNTPAVIQSELQAAMADGFRPTLAIVFISIKQDRKLICEILDREGIDILGATSCGEFINGYQDTGSTVILLMDLNRDAYTILFSPIEGDQVSGAATELTRQGMEKFRRPAFILCTTGLSSTGALLDGEAVVRSMGDLIGPGINVYGGMAGDDATFAGTCVFTNGRETDKGLATLVLDEDKVSLHGMAISGWKPLGITRTVTKSKDNYVYTIDDQPALDLYLKYLGKKQADVPTKYNIFEEVGVHYPFQLERESGAPVMRTPISLDEAENALIFDLSVPQGSKVRFSMPPDFDIVEKVLGDARELKDAAKADAEALLIFSCAGRFSALGPLAKLENDGLGDVWNAPMAGFFTYGEYGRTINGQQEFHSTTCCWVTLKEKDRINTI